MVDDCVGVDQLSPSISSNADFGLLGTCSGSTPGSRPTSKSSNSSVTNSERGKPGMCVKVEDIVNANEIIRKSGKPNAFCARIPIFTTVNLDYLHNSLIDYEDTELIEFLKFGWPVNFEGEPLNHIPKNHASATNNPGHIVTFLRKAEALQSVIGPFRESTFSAGFMSSPLASVDKSNSTDRRIILDMSFPEGKSVNDGIPKKEYLGEPYMLRLPRVDDIVAMIRRKGVGCAIFKRDLKSAYRQLVRADYGDVHLLGFVWENQLYFDLTHPQGCRSAALCCQRTSSGIIFIHKKTDPEYEAINYLDDLIGAEKWSKASQAFIDLGDVLLRAGITEASQKASAPDVEMIGLGVLFNTIAMTVSITEERLEEIKTLVLEWSDVCRANFKEVKSLLGKLSFVAACVRPARIFLSRMFAVLCSFPKNRTIELPSGFKDDLFWWQMFMPLYNGISMMAPELWSCPDSVFASDACLSGCGAYIPASREFFHMMFPEFIVALELHINELEFLAIIVSCKLWGALWRGHRILINCDNEATVHVINNLKTGDHFMQSCLRELFHICAKFDFEVRANHISGVSNRIPDFLSRFHLDASYRSRFYKEIGGNGIDCTVPVEFFKFQFDW